MNSTLMRKTALLGFLSLSATMAFGNDIPTRDRVEYVLECMRSNPGPRQEMLYKCSCNLDALASEFSSVDEYVEAQTAANALSIGGERGAVLRESEEGKALAGRYRAAVAKAKKACFMN